DGIRDFHVTGVQTCALPIYTQAVTSFTSPDPATEGTLTLNPDGTFTFEAVAGFEGTLDIPYTVEDDGHPVATAGATLHLVVEGQIGRASGRERVEKEVVA